MSIINDLKDRIEYCIEGEWFVVETISVTCPVCKDITDVVQTYEDGATYCHRDPDRNEWYLCWMGNDGSKERFHPVPFIP